MKRNTITLTVGLILIAIFAVLLFTYQVRQTEVALVTTFGKPSRDKKEPGLYFKMPWPIESVQIFDKRVQNFEDKLEETYTQDRFTLDVMVYAGWTIDDPKLFRAGFGGSVSRAQNALEGLIRTAKLAVVGQHPFSHFISTDENELKFGKIEEEILGRIQATASNNYGISVQFVGIKMLRLPERITASVFDRMKEERQRVVQGLEGEGDSAASTIRGAADLSRDKILAEADTQANRIRSEAESEAAKFYAVLERNPDLAILLSKLKTLEASLKERSTLIFDQHTVPFDLLNSTGLPPASVKGNAQ
jgi:membrane protease subunit HflC